MPTAARASTPWSDIRAAPHPASSLLLVGFVVEVVERWTFEPDGWTERVRSVRHADSALRPLTDDEVEAGIASVRATFAGTPGPIVSDTVLRLLVLGAVEHSGAATI